MADETIKYSKDGTKDVFENFEPWHYGEPAIPDNLYFLGTDEEAKGYQQYFDNNGYGIQEINVADFKINDKPIRGCKKGTVVTVNELDRGQYDTQIWVEDGKAYYKKQGTKTELKNKTGVPLKRLGIALVGGGGACGDCKTEKWKNKCHTFDTTMPGGGGGGGGVIWGIINLELANKPDVYTIKVGTGGSSKGASGKDTTLSHNKAGTLAIAGGGGGGGTGRKSGAAGGTGGICAFENNKYFIKCGQKDGKPGGSYSELDVENENQSINSTVEANRFDITFIPDGKKLEAGSYKHDGIGGKIKDIAENAGHVYFAVPGGNSFGSGGLPNGNVSLFLPDWGGGGMCWTFNDNDPENIWADNANSFKANSTKARCGADGGWILFY